ncbi:MAG: hypothetical protein PHE77_00560 [Candidatus Pacebacteria bacterium]|nr:hypothetical protein [Candidatus Paceibacterota bacterium]
MIPRFKKNLKVPDPHLKKEQFLEEHNKLAPENLRATVALLSRFREEKASLFHNDDWPIDKFRRPFILWLTSLYERKMID